MSNKKKLALCALCASICVCADDAKMNSINYLRVNEYSMAMDASRTEFAQAKTTEEKARALYVQAQIFLLRTEGADEASGLALLRKIQKDYGETQTAPWAALAEARYCHLTVSQENPDFSKTLRHYAVIQEKYPDSMAAREAFLFTQTIRLLSQSEAELKEVEKTLLERYRAPESTPFLKRCIDSLLEVLYGEGKLNEPEKYLASLIRHFECTRDHFPRIDRSGACWKIAVTAEFKVGDFATARKFYHLLLTEYPTDARTFGAELALKRMDDLEAEVRKP